MFEARVLNIPYYLMKRCKDDKVLFEMLACASIIKEIHPNSVLYLNLKNVVACFGVCYRKAKKLIEQMKESDLFIYNENKNCVYAKTFKSGSWTTYRYGKKGKFLKAFYDRCYKLDVTHRVNLRTRVKQLRCALAVIRISSKWRSCFNVKTQSAEQPIEKQALTHLAIGKAIGMSKSSGRRYVNSLINQGRVSKSGIVAECVIDDLNSETEAEWRSKNPGRNFLAWHTAKCGGWSGWIVYGSVYTLNSQEDFKSMQRVVWNHRDRVKEACDDDEQSCAKYYEKMEHRKIGKKFFTYA